VSKLASSSGISRLLNVKATLAKVVTKHAIALLSTPAPDNATLAVDALDAKEVETEALASVLSWFSC
tara:strand:+ start:307 stop:507 length:201 start_codon:yes stop_codon:yes gene_type:complete